MKFRGMVILLLRCSLLIEISWEQKIPFYFSLCLILNSKKHLHLIFIDVFENVCLFVINEIFEMLQALRPFFSGLLFLNG